MEQKQSIFPRNIEDEMKNSYIDYAMSVIVGRALPDVKDGLKPVHRRILYSMYELGLFPNKAFKKSARVVGETLGKYHPHGDTAVYDAMVRMVQDFSLRYPLLTGQGNFGSIDGDAPAAMRYTEIKLGHLAMEMLKDIDKNTVGFVPNFDESLKEPVVLPSSIPNLIINGSSGIAVGMATNIPPHNLNETIEALILMIDQPEVSVEDLIKVIKGPDFPTGGIIYGSGGIKDAYKTGRGTIKVRAYLDIEQISSGKQAIIIKEIPFQVNKSALLESIATLVRERKITGISNIRDESDRKGMRVVIEIKRDENIQVILNQLYQHTQLEVTYGIIFLALVDNVPKVLNLHQMLSHYLQHRKDVITRRTQFELDKANRRAHIVEGLKVALEHLDKVIRLIRQAEGVDDAKEKIIKEFKLTKAQANAILEMRLHQLPKLERKKLDEEYLELIKLIEKLKSILANPKRLMGVIKEDLLEIKRKYADNRRTKIVKKTVEVGIEDLIAEEDVIVTISHAGYIKRLPLTSYRLQKRGGRGVTGANLREEDFLEDVFVTSTHSYLLFFTDLGRVYWLKVYEIPEGTRTSRGKAIVNLLRLSSLEERITAMVSVREFEEGVYLVMATKKGIIKKTSLLEYSNPRQTGIRAINLDEKDTLIAVKLSAGKGSIFLATKNGYAIRFSDKSLRPIGRTSKGVIGIKLSENDEVVGMEVVEENEFVLTVTENGFGKRTPVKVYRQQARAGKGVINIKTTSRNGKVVAIRKVSVEDDIVLITQKGLVLRHSVKEIRAIGRMTQGVKLIRIEKEDKLSSLAKISPEEVTE